MKRKLSLILCLLMFISILLSSCEFLKEKPKDDEGDGDTPGQGENISLDDIPAFDGESPYVVINGNVPFFEDERCDSSYESYSELDSLGRCGVAIACLGPDLMPTEDREDIGHVQPSGWHSVQYDVVPGRNLYNRCHLIGFQLTGENDNEKNLITGTRDMNNEGMLLFENQVADYIKETNNHVMYRVTPLYAGNNLVASGVQIEAYSVEDEGDGIEFNVYFYNVQPMIYINYATGDSRLAEGDEIISPQPDASTDETTSNEGTESSSTENDEAQDYVLNTNTKKFHKPSCSSATEMSQANRQDRHDTRENIIADGYEPCGKCHP